MVMRQAALVSTFPRRHSRSIAHLLHTMALDYAVPLRRDRRKFLRRPAATAAVASESRNQESDITSDFLATPATEFYKPERGVYCWSRNFP